MSSKKNKVNKQKKQLKQMKRGSTASGVFMFLFTIAAVLIGLISFVSMVVIYAVDSKLNSEYRAIKYMADIYENGKDNSIYEILDMEGRDYVIRDKSGNSIHESGKITCGNDIKAIDFQFTDRRINVIKDDEISFIYPDSEHNLKFDSIEFIKAFYNDPGVAEENELIGYPDDPEKIEYESELLSITSVGDNPFVIRLPLWVAINVKDQSEIFIAKALLNIEVRDFAMLAFTGLMVVLLIFFSLLAILIMLITSIIRSKNIEKTYFTDTITGGHNWAWFEYNGDKLLSKKKNAKNEYAVINFVVLKYRNYCVCHSMEEGEKLLTRVYDYISKSLNKKEMLAHCTPSNFAILLEYSDKENLEIRLKALIAGLEQLSADHSFSFHVGVNVIGESKDESGRYVKRRVSVEEEYNNSVTAGVTLSENEDSGIAFFDEKLIEEQKWIDKVNERSRAAIENEEFVVYYQPKYDPRTDTLKGAEALIRWNSPDMGLIPPGRFIPIFEKNGFITEIDHYMLSHVARDQKKWLDEGKEIVPVSVNVSRAHFIESDLAEQIRDTVDSAGAPREFIEIELTESAFFDDKKSLVNTIDKLRSYGFSVSMDDFGSGYSSLNSLKDMPLDVLKLDAEFFRGDRSDSRGEIVVSETIKLAKSLNMKTVAEGVEEKEQVEFLAEQGCDLIQGYYYAKPMPGEEYEKKMTQTNEKAEE